MDLLLCCCGNGLWCPSFGFTEVGYGASCGLSIFISLASSGTAPKADDLENPEKWDFDLILQSLLNNLVRPLVLLAFGFVVALVIGV